METISNGQRRSIESALRDTLRMLAKWEARRTYAKPEGVTETNYNNETHTLRAGYRQHACYLQHMVFTGMWFNSNTIF